MEESEKLAISQIMSEPDGESRRRKMNEEKIKELNNAKKIELEKGEGLCKKTEAALYECFDDLFSLRENFSNKMTHYFSGRKRGVFDEWDTFLESMDNDGGFAFKVITFSKDEIESYAKSHRTYKCFLDGRTNFIKVFEFKPSKI